ncbi:MAG: pentapeptide repeat-containing protein [Cyanobacteria bacterium P01_F01_bin.143]
MFFLEILEKVEHITILIVLFTFIATEEQRRNAEVYQAWQVITAAHDQSGSGGRIEALEFLLSRPRRFPFFWLRWKEENLAGLAVQKAYLREVNLQDANLEQANLQDAILLKANLQNAGLLEANLQNTDLLEANLQDAFLLEANLTEANLTEANLQDAFLREANLTGANLTEANLQDAFFREANLTGANLTEANLTGAFLREANLTGANLTEAKNLSFEQIKSTCFWESSFYRAKYNDKENKWLAIEPDNKDFIKALKENVSSDPKESPDCSIWKDK